MTQSPRHLPLLTLALVTLAVACSPFRITTTQDPVFDFESTHTFSLRDARAEVEDAEERERRALVLERIRSVLVAKGYAETSEEDADFWVTFDAATNEQRKEDEPLEPNEQWGGYDSWARYNPTGKLAILVRNPADSEVIWNGYAHTTFYEGEEHERTPRALEGAERILASFPERSP